VGPLTASAVRMGTRNDRWWAHLSIEHYVEMAWVRGICFRVDDWIKNIVVEVDLEVAQCGQPDICAELCLRD
jgi:hypothetical protein